MPRAQTVYSELEVARGIIGEMGQNFFTSLSIKGVSALDFDVYRAELKTRNQGDGVSPLYQAGRFIAEHLNKNGSDYSVYWCGNERQSPLHRVAVDLLIPERNYRISVKEKSKIVTNASPQTLFINVLNGSVLNGERGDDWFIQNALKELESYFQAVGGSQMGYSSVVRFYHLADTDKRKALAEQIGDKGESEYRDLTGRISERTADLFNRNCQKRLYEYYLYYFFRMNALPHIVAGVDFEDKPFACMVPSSTTFNQNFEVLDIKAIAGFSKQAEVFIDFHIQNRYSLMRHMVKLKVEIRWAHGKFCGNPEAKVYASGWEWSELPWVNNLN